MNLKEAVQYLMEQGYMVQIKGKYKVTAKFNKEMTGQELGVRRSSSGLTVQEHPTTMVTAQQSVDWTQRYISFIKEAEVPQRGTGGSGSYDLNKYSDDAMKQFRKMIEKEGVYYPVLVKSTMLYYKTHSKYAVTITHYIKDGLWRTDYQALIESAQEGKLSDHIQNEIDNEKEFSRFKLG